MYGILDEIENVENCLFYLYVCFIELLIGIVN